VSNSYKGMARRQGQARNVLVFGMMNVVKAE
jgi:hypothetical protein